MLKKLLLIDYENIHKVDLSLLDESYRAIFFVGANQNPPKASRNKATAHRFSRVDFHKIEGSGKNALDFHIAFQLGRTIETDPQTECFVLSKDKGFDPLLSHLNKNGLKCIRVDSLEELPLQPVVQAPIHQRKVREEHAQQPIVKAPATETIVCGYCGKASTIEHYGGHWCSNCGRFATPADQNQLPSNQIGYLEPKKSDYYDSRILGQCGWCHQKKDMSDGIYDDGEWMCGECIAGYIR